MPTTIRTPLIFYDFRTCKWLQLSWDDRWPSLYTTEVYYFAPNVYGLYDMAGNVEEWCWDRYGTPYGQPTTTDPTGSATGTDRVQRGGGWNQPAPLAEDVPFAATTSPPCLV